MQMPAVGQPTTFVQGFAMPAAAAMPPGPDFRSIAEALEQRLRQANAAHEASVLATNASPMLAMTELDRRLTAANQSTIQAKQAATAALHSDADVIANLKNELRVY